MSKSTQINRRSFLYGQIAIASTIGFAGTAYGRGRSQELNHDTSQLGAGKQPSWKTGTADQFAKFINQPFTAVTLDGN